jgi:alpha-D-ribose 1-methylphosphonate 5-triphosphate synthase subunit PhnL
VPLSSWGCFRPGNLNDAPILALDEPASNLDAEGEQALVATLRSVTEAPARGLYARRSTRQR